ncbi:Uncharacterized protein DAT39_022144 [Clarias magur]|uniref:Uncharacterized protein n=1 Tax=Clarias magur TaxID=1594786 RepID=A0A8J4T477_CLAMG|nr:Uncharacterized protein DAT39_022144 [Clarias magur]
MNDSSPVPSDASSRHQTPAACPDAGLNSDPLVNRSGTDRTTCPSGQSLVPAGSCWFQFSTGWADVGGAPVSSIPVAMETVSMDQEVSVLQSRNFSRNEADHLDTSRSTNSSGCRGTTTHQGGGFSLRPGGSWTSCTPARVQPGTRVSEN